MGAGAPLLQKVVKEVSDGLRSLLGHLEGAKVLDQQLHGDLELLVGLHYPLQAGDVVEDVVPERLVQLPHPEQLGADVAVDMASAHQPDGRLAEHLEPHVADLPGPVRHPEPGHSGWEIEHRKRKETDDNADDTKLQLNVH
jgi:hypothetical protein